MALFGGSKFRTVALSGVFAAGLLAVTAGAANAEVYKFFNGTNTYAGAYSTGAYQDTIGIATSCPLIDNCSGDYFASSMTFDVTVGASNIVTATTNASNIVYDDLGPNYGGIGVSPSDDQVSGTEILTLTFTDQVRLLNVVTLFQGPPGSHNPFGLGTLNDAAKVLSEETSGLYKFLMDTDGAGFVKYTFDKANLGVLNVVGTVFSFMQYLGDEDHVGGPSFYVSALTVVDPSQTVVPIPAALPLFLGGLGVLTLMRRRKRSQPARAA